MVLRHQLIHGYLKIEGVPPTVSTTGVVTGVATGTSMSIYTNNFGCIKTAIDMTNSSPQHISEIEGVIFLSQLRICVTA
jgi:hypothetical protein